MKIPSDGAVIEGDLIVEVMAKRPVVIARVSRRSLDGETILRFGTAQCHPEDDWDIELGIDLAISRALARHARDLEQHVRSIVKHRDDVKAHQASREDQAEPSQARRFGQAGVT